jgi:hypothetical protein
MPDLRALAIISAWLLCAAFFGVSHIAGYRYLRTRGLAEQSFIPFVASMLFGDIRTNYRSFYLSYGSERGFRRARFLIALHLLSFPLLILLSLAL